MAATAEYFQQPRAATPQGLYLWAQQLTDQLRRLQQTDATEATANDNELAAELAAFEAQLAAMQVQIDALTSGSGLTAQQLFELGLSSQVDTLFGSAGEYAGELIKYMQRITEGMLLHQARSYENSALIRTEQQTRVTETETFAQQVTIVQASLVNEATARINGDNSLQGQINTTNAAVVTETTARTAADTALASNITTVQTQVNGNSSSITSLLSSVDGIESRWGVTINAQGQVTGLVLLDGTSTGTTFTVVADKFLIGQPSTTGGDPIPVFTISNVDGVAKLAFRGDMYADGFLLARHIVAGAVTAAAIAAGTITADKMNVTALSALTANLGTVTAGLIRNSADTFRFDLPNMRIYGTNGKFDIDAIAGRIRVEV